MIVDKALEFSLAQVVSGSSTDTPSAEAVDTLAAERAIGVGTTLGVAVTFVAAGANKTVNTVVKLQTAPASGGTWATVAQFTIADDYPAGTQRVIPVPPGTERFLRLAYTTGSASPITVTAQMALDTTQQHAYPVGSGIYPYV